jgi:cytochrome c556
MRTALAVAMLVGFAVAACDRQPPAAEPTPREKMAREFTQAMKSLDLELEGIALDLKANKPTDSIRGRLVKIKTTAERASRLPYRPADAENRDLAFEFTRFTGEAGKLENANWSGDDGMRAYTRLSKSCAPCHELYRPD